ncbi:MAG: CRISPR-associated endonuclease Cas3'' [Phycisphaerales bacterium]|nr:CRISPR-associated endonuclease Cas3'' [Phycisphaerales bacterium]
MAGHLRMVAEGDDTFGGAAGFASVFGDANLGRVAGMWHDLGKYAPQFRQYLQEAAVGRATRGSVDYSKAGTLMARRQATTDSAGVLAFIIAGHHAGLPDLGTPSSALVQYRSVVGSAPGFLATSATVRF